MYDPSPLLVEEGFFIGLRTIQYLLREFEK